LGQNVNFHGLGFGLFFVDDVAVEVELAGVFRLEVAGFQVDHDKVGPISDLESVPINKTAARLVAGQGTA
jgi:hypothetical protein